MCLWSLHGILRELFLIYCSSRLKRPYLSAPTHPHHSYAVFLVGRRINGEWPNRTLYLTAGKLLVDVAKLVVYVAYFLILFANYGMPLIMVRRRLKEARSRALSSRACPLPVGQIRDLIRAFVDVNRELGNLVASRRLRGQVCARVVMFGEAACFAPMLV
jgi:hypothetical protein